MLDECSSTITGGKFTLELFLPEEYPMSPPKVRFLTKIYHPNIGEWLLYALKLFARYLCSYPCRQAWENLFRYSEGVSTLSSLRPRLQLNRLLDKWSPALQIRTVLLSIQALLSAPNPDDPLATDVAKHYKTDEKDAQRVSREWTEKYGEHISVELLFRLLKSITANRRRTRSRTVGWKYYHSGQSLV